jgi:hypothetical protein
MPASLNSDALSSGDDETAAPDINPDQMSVKETEATKMPAAVAEAVSYDGAKTGQSENQGEYLRALMSY